MSNQKEIDQSRIIAAPGPRRSAIPRGRATKGGSGRRIVEGTTSPDSMPRILRKVEREAANALFVDESVPRNIGRYSVLRKLGEGAMGAVFACYDERLERKVAVKILKVDAMGDQNVASARLVREGQALARLSHPNVVTVHEVGLTDNEVYVAMEFVRGVRLDIWAREQHTWQETLEVFIQAGRGLAAAHKAGVVHRDFKPQNVIVNEENLVKVLDFGLARTSGEKVPEQWLEHSGTEHARADLGTELLRPLTVTGALVGTPAYMSPEQYCGDPVTAASDQFSFCVALYQCLYGLLPFTTSSYTALRNEIMSGQVAPAPLRSPVPTWVYRCLTKGMNTFADERYGSMNELLAVLDRRRMSRRALLATSFAAATLTGIASFFVATQTTETAVEICPDASSELTGIWDDTRRQQVRTAIETSSSPQAAVVTASVLPHLDTYTDAWRSMRNEACLTHAEGRQADGLFDLRMACLDQRLAGLTTLTELLAQPQSNDLTTLAQAAFSLPALDPCADASALLEDVSPPDDPDLRQQVQNHRENLSRALVLHAAGKTDAGLKLVNQALDDHTAMAYLPLAAEVELNRGYMLLNTDPTAAAQSLQQSILHATRADHDKVAAQASSRLAFVHTIKLAKPEQAQADLPLVQALNERFSDDVDLYAEYLNNTGYIQTQLGDRSKAVDLLEQAHALRQKHGRTKTPLALMTLMNLSITMYTDGRFEEAIARAQATIRSATELFGPQAYQVVFSRQLLAASHLQLGRPRKVIEILKPHMSDMEGNTRAMALLVLAESELANNNPSQARDYLNAALPSFPPSSVMPDNTLHLLLRVAALTGDEPLMQSYYDQAQQRLTTYPSPDDYRAPMLRLSYGRALTTLGRPLDALPPLEHLRESLPDDFNTIKPEVLPLLSLSLGIAYRRAGNLDAAQTNLTRAVDECDDHRPLLRAEALHNLGLVALARQQYDTAVEILTNAQALYSATAEHDFLPLAHTRFALARALTPPGTPPTPQALKLAQMALDAFHSHATPHNLEVQAWLANHR